MSMYTSCYPQAYEYVYKLLPSAYEYVYKL